MIYSEEVIKSVINRFIDDESDIEEISTELDVSKSVVCGWLTPENGINDDESLKKLSKRVRELVRQKKFSEARQICGNFSDDKIIQSQLVTILIEQNELKEAKKICSRFSEHTPIQSQLVTILLKEGNVLEAKKICEKFKDDEGLQSYLAKILKFEGNRSEAKKICENFRDGEAIQSQLVKLLVEEDELEEAKAICDRFKDSEILQEQLQRILIKKNRKKSMGEFFADETSQVMIKAKERGEMEDVKSIGDIRRCIVGDLRARMQFVMLLKKYGMNDVVQMRLKEDDEIYQEIYRLLLFARDNPDFSQTRIFKLKFVKSLKNKIMLNGGSLRYATEIINKTIKRDTEEHDL